MVTSARLLGLFLVAGLLLREAGDDGRALGQDAGWRTLRFSWELESDREIEHAVPGTEVTFHVFLEGPEQDGSIVAGFAGLLDFPRDLVVTRCELGFPGTLVLPATTPT